MKVAQRKRTRFARQRCRECGARIEIGSWHRVYRRESDQRNNRSEVW
jgi:hypothetical protein